MMELRRSNDLVYLSWARVVLLDAGVDTVLLDDNVSSVEGSIGAIPRRLMVPTEQLVQARGVLARAEAEVAAGPAGGEPGDGL